MEINFNRNASEWLIPALQGFQKSEGKFKIRIQGHFESSHYLYSYFPDGSDEPMHGHSWRVEVYLTRMDASVDENGICYDFLSARKRLDELLERIDHTCINDLTEFSGVNPTSENIARWFYKGLHDDVNNSGGKILEIRVHEGHSNYASYFPE